MELNFDEMIFQFRTTFWQKQYFKFWSKAV